MYPVISRRSHGLSIGLNVNPTKHCNFNCLYCQVDRREPSTVRFDLGVAERELRAMLDLVTTGAFAKQPPFASLPAEDRQLRDIALSGDGEPTLLTSFADVVTMVAGVKPAGVKLLLLTDASGLHRPEVRRGLTVMDEHDGEIWAKLDAGTEAYYRFINRSAVPFTRVLQNLTACAADRPVVIQSLFLKAHGVGPSADEIAAYCDRLNEIVAAGGRIARVQVCTLARKAMTVVNGQPAWQFVTALSRPEVDAIAAVVRRRTGLPAETFYGD